MIKWAGRLIVFIGAGHLLISLVLTAPHYAEAWFTGGIWNENLAEMSQANGAYWLTLGSFAIPQILLGLMVLWLDRRGIVPPTFIAWTLIANTVLCGLIFGPSPWPVDLISSGLLLAGARRAARQARIAHPTPGVG